jgi:hypothetical protein
MRNIFCIEPSYHFTTTGIMLSNLRCGDIVLLRFGRKFKITSISLGTANGSGGVVAYKLYFEGLDFCVDYLSNGNFYDMLERRKDYDCDIIEVFREGGVE